MNTSKIRYYLFLLQKKFNIRIHNLLEKKVENNNLRSMEDFQFFLFKIIFSNLIKTENGIYFNTKVKNKNKPNTLAQVRILISFCKLHNNKQIIFNVKYIIENLKNFILSIRENSGIYKFNQKSWNLQDEGIATIWVLLALLKVYEITNDLDLLNEIVDTIDLLHKNLVDEKNSLLHNLGDDYWCLNAASTYAFFAGQFLNYHYDEKMLKNYIKAVELCISKLTPEGYFPYSEKRL